MSEVKEIKVFNNLGRKKEVFKTIEVGKVRFYSCGPTTYDFLHVGNARALVVGDLFNRIMRSLGYEVTFVRNFTDVDDKIIERAKELNVDALEHSAKFVEECKKDMDSLGMTPADHTPKVSETMDEIVGMIETLIKKGNAYVVDGEVLYDVHTFKDYGKLSLKDLKNLEHGRRVEVEAHKKNPADFVLWKPAKQGEVSWDSPWGKGRPGWHIECSAMAKKILGDNIDLHHGGIDLMFPHHENEVAQSEAANGSKFCNHWCHNEFLNFGTEKMSKSLGNVITIRKFVETYGGEVLRQILISVHYRSKMEWSEEVVNKAINDLERLHNFIVHYTEAKKTNFDESTKSEDVVKELSKIVPEMKDDLANDFNVPGAMAKLFSVVRLVNKDFLDENQNYTKKKKLNSEIVKELDGIISFSTMALGCFYENAHEVLSKINKARKKLKSPDGASDEVEIEKLIAVRKQARLDKNWQRSDEIRDELSAMNVVIKDNPDGSTTWQYK